MALEAARTKGTGKAGFHSSRWAPRADVKTAAKKERRREDVLTASFSSVRRTNRGGRDRGE